jgi:hypothetical protein
VFFILQNGNAAAPEVGSDFQMMLDGIGRQPQIWRRIGSYMVGVSGERRL